MIKEYLFAYKFSILCLILIWILCLMPFPEMPDLPDIPLKDKWTHFVMYGGTCSIIWLEYLLKHRTKRNYLRVLVWAVIAPTMMGGLLEILQATCTNGNRSGEFMDFIANALGVLIGAGIGWFILRRIIKESCPGIKWQ